MSNIVELLGVDTLRICGQDVTLAVEEFPDDIIGCNEPGKISFSSDLQENTLPVLLLRHVISYVSNQHHLEKSDPRTLHYVLSTSLTAFLQDNPEAAGLICGD